MSDLQLHLDSVRRAWQRAEALRGVALLVAEAVVLVVVLVAVDALYLLPPAMRGVLLGLGGLLLLVTALRSVARPLRRIITDQEVALHVESRHPELRGTLLAATEYEGRATDNPLQASLVAALVGETLKRSAVIDPGGLIDRRRLGRLAALAGVLLVAAFAATATWPDLAGHQLARVLTPWSTPAPSVAELAALKQQTEREELARRARAELARAQRLAAGALVVEPGDAEVQRGHSLRVEAEATRRSGPLTLRFQTTGGVWRTLAMAPLPEHPDRFYQDLRDLTEDLRYQVTMPGVESPTYAVTVYDLGVLKDLSLTYHYPAYTKWPDKTVAKDGNIDALEGTTVTVAITASVPVKTASIERDGTAPQAMSVAAGGATGPITVAADGGYRIKAADAKGRPIAGLEERFLIRMRKDQPPRLEVLYPAIDSVVHPMEEVACAAKAEDDVGLKEIRLRSTYNLEPEVIQRKVCTAAEARAALAEFLIALEARGKIEPGDTMFVFMEAEDLKGQVAIGDLYTIAPRGYESFVIYGHPGKKHVTKPKPKQKHDVPPELITVIGAAHQLEGKRAELTPEELKKECEKIAEYLLTTSKGK
jgi:hypothetical protein